ncbi:B-cell receptor CD22-like [Phyllobates terribilis]|uniref:B-cell receptor CD22-like n=1 Tax=Phyllobates terribilis TaxID=111132 RepID=UPI003CCB010C
MIRFADSRRMAGVKQMFLLIVFQGFYLGSLCQWWTFPSSITALNGSCVEIPCTYYPASRTSTGTVWYIYNKWSYLEVLNTEKQSSVKKEYKNRTSLVPGYSTCTLRIDNVRTEDKNEYYPGITGDKKTNAYDEHSRTVTIDVRDSPEDIHLLYMSQPIIEGEATTIRCAAYHTCRSSPPYIQWNKMGQIKNKSVYISKGYLREESYLTYTPSYVDDGTIIQCTATYPNGQTTVGSSTMSIRYSPRNVTVTIIEKDEAIEGSNVTLQCNSSSKPDIYEYEWYKGKNKTKLPDTRMKFGIRNVTRDMEQYSCAAINDVGRGESALTEISVLYPASGVHITVKNENDLTKLICDFLSSRPDVTHYTWMKNGSLLHNETGKTLTIDNKEENYGKYSCVAHNRVGDSSSDEIYIKRVMVDLFLILGTLAGVFFLLIFILVIYVCVRSRKLKVTRSKAAEFPDATYCDLMKKDIENEYDVLKISISSHTTNTGRHGGTTNEYQ